MKNPNTTKTAIYFFINNILHAIVIAWGFDIVPVLRSRIILDFRKPESVYIHVFSSPKKIITK